MMYVLHFQIQNCAIFCINCTFLKCTFFKKCIEKCIEKHISETYNLYKKLHNSVSENVKCRKTYITHTQDV